MNKIYNYLIKLGVVEKTSENRRVNYPIELHTIKYGDNYFYNAPNFFYDAYMICFDYNIASDPAYFNMLRETEKKIRKYCKRYGYIIFNHYIHTWSSSFCIAKEKDRNASERFYYYRDKAIEEVNETIHLWSMSNTPANNDIIRGIMDKYGNEYNNELLAM